jgi:outer membrane protein assembly factor BamC
MPPDLTQLAKDNRAQVQGGSSAPRPCQPKAVQLANAQPWTDAVVAANAAGDIRLERSGASAGCIHSA